MPDPWLAVDVSTPPAARARIVRRAWEGFLEGEHDLRVRQPIADSWTRCQDAGVAHAGEGAAPVLIDEDEAQARWEAHPLATVTPLIRRCLAPIADEPNLIVVSDAQGMLLWIDGDHAVRRAAEQMSFFTGTLWSERSAGTNAVGTAVAADHAVQVFAAEHFREVVQTWTCSACPVHDPDSGDLLGVIDLTGRMSTVHAYSLALAVSTAQAVEAHLRVEMQQRNARLAERFAPRVLSSRSPRALLSPHGRVIVANDAWRRASLRVVRGPGSGRMVVEGEHLDAVESVLHGEAYIAHVQPAPKAPSPRPTLSITLLDPAGPRAEIDGVAVPLRRRQAEILALLAVSSHGLSAEQLATSLYGDRAKPGSVRVEISRLRKRLGPWIAGPRYRLADAVRCDVREVRSLLESGHVGEAVARHEAGILPHSDAPGVVRERDQLGHWLRQSVLSCDDADVLWRWVSSAAGEDDLVAWRRLLPRLPVRDARRPFALARTAALRERLAAPV